MSGQASVQTMQNDNTMELQPSDRLTVAPKSMARAKNFTCRSVFTSLGPSNPESLFAVPPATQR